MTVVTFIIFNVAGGDPTFELAGKNATIEQIESLKKEMGLDKSFFEQYLVFVRQIVTFDWGRSWHTHESINKMLWRGVGPTLSLTLPAFIMSFLICLFFATLCTHHRQKWFDRTVIVTCLSMMSISFLVYIIVFQYLFAFVLGWFPINGWDPSLIIRWKYLVLPWLISITVSLGPNILLYRSALLDEVAQDYVITAKAKGVSNIYLYSRHILKNAIIPIFTLLIIQVPFLITGSLLLEAFFGIPGLGGLLMQAIQTTDFPIIKAMTVLGSIIYMFFNLFADICYAYFDPRVEF